MKSLFPFLILFLVAAIASGQVKEKFQEQLLQDSLNKDFEGRIITIDRLFSKGIKSVSVDSLMLDTAFTFIERDTVSNKEVLKFDLTSEQKSVYDNLEASGKINRLKLLRADKHLKILSRGIASDVTLPRKTNPNQSYNDFYLDVIKRLLKSNADLVKQDDLSFAKYQSWERAENLPSQDAVRDYRETFIRFLYKHYHFD